jgi:hypothetical protein
MISPKLRKIAKKHSSILRRKYNNADVIKSITNFYSSDTDVTVDDINQLLTANNIPESSKSVILSKYKSTLEMSDNGLNLIKNQFKKFISAILLTEASKIKDPANAIEFVNSYDGNFIDDSKISSKITEYEFSDVNIDEVINEFGEPIKSSIESINDCSVIGGYIKHQLVAVVAPPSCGKSLFLMNEMSRFLKNGLKVCYIALGDLTRYDFVTRLPSIHNNITIDDAMMDPKSAWIGFKNSLGSKSNNFKVFYIDANVLTSDELLEYIYDNELDKEFDVFMVDYDSNFRSTNDMYQKGDEIYNNMVNLAKRVSLVFIASQPKNAAYSQEIIYMNDAAESSRKQQIVDLMITISKNQNSKTQIGYINLAKVRRGFKSIAFPYMLSQSGKFIPINMQKYKALEQSTKIKDISHDKLPKFTNENKDSTKKNVVDDLMAQFT